MTNNIRINSKCIENNDLETEDGEIDDRLSAETKRKEDDIENYYLSLNELSCDLRCSCCGVVFSDPVKLKCQHLMDRSCAVIKKNGNTIECFLCHCITICDDVDQLITDFDIASRIPLNPNSLISVINNQPAQLVKSNEEKKSGLIKLNGNSEETTKPRKRKRKTRWDKVDDHPQTFTGAIMDILLSHNLSKNITISQYKKFTEISNKSSVMSLLTKAVLQSVDAEIGDKTDTKKSCPYSDSEILEMIPSNDLDDLFELEKLQFIKLYRDALDKGVISPPSSNKFPKLPLLPTPFQLSSNDSTKSFNDCLPTSQRKCSTPDSNDLDFSDKSSLASCNISNLDQPENVSEPLILPDEGTVTKDTDECTRNAPSEEVNHVREDSARYRDSVTRLHSIYSTMYHASLTMKDLQNDVQSANYQAAYKTYSDNYIEYQTLYSSLQTAISIDSVVTEKSDSILLENSSDTNVTLLSQSSRDQSATGIFDSNLQSTIVIGQEVTSSTDELRKIVHSQFPSNAPVQSTKTQNVQQFRTQVQVNNRNKFGFLWISNLGKEPRANDLCKLFSKYGHVSKIKLFQYKAQTPMTYFSLIFMPNFVEAETAYLELQNTIFFDRPIHIKMLCPPIEAM